MINLPALTRAAARFSGGEPFPFCVVDDFLDDALARRLSDEFPAKESFVWHDYSSPIEIKRTCNQWNVFPRETYKTFSVLNSPEFVKLMGGLFGVSPLYADYGLNGGGMHLHGRGGKLNPHLDYSLHPKTSQLRKLNLLVYLNPNWQDSWGGSLGLYERGPTDRLPGELVKIIRPMFNRAVIFDTTCQSWHGLCEPITCPEGEYRKSLAVYYLTEAPAEVDRRSKALFAPTADQAQDDDVLALIERRTQGAYV